MQTFPVILVAAKLVLVGLGLKVFLRLLVREYERMAAAMADRIAQAALERARNREEKDGPRITLSPADEQ